MKPRHQMTSRTDRPSLPPQKQKSPGPETKMIPEPLDDDPEYRGSGKLQGKVALVSGGDRTRSAHRKTVVPCR